MRTPLFPSLIAGWIAAAAMTITGPARATFQTELIDSVGLPGHRSSMVLDASGVPHVAYSYQWGPCGDISLTEGIRYATRSGGVWTSEVLPDGPCPLVAPGPFSLALDSAGNVGIVLVETRLVGGLYVNDLVYATRPGGVWTYELIETAGPPATNWRDPKLRYDSDDRPCVAYGNNRLDLLKYAVRVDGVWEFEVVDDVGDPGGYNSLAFDAAGAPCISYSTYQPWGLRYATKSGGSWSTEPIDIGADLNGCTSLRLDSQFRPHISYSRPSGNVALAVKEGGVWDIQEVPVVAERPANDIYLALDADDRPHLVFTDRDADELLYVLETANGWFSFVIDDDAFREASFAIDDQGVSHVVYSRWNAGTFHHATNMVAAGAPVGTASTLPKLRLSPNPAYAGVPSSIAAFGLAGSGLASLSPSAQVEVFDVTGKRVARVPANSAARSEARFEWDAQVPAGVYNFRLVDGRVVARGRGVVIR